MLLCNAVYSDATLKVTMTNVTTFQWRPTPWSRCVYRQPMMCCNCYRTRRVDCVMYIGIDIVGRVVPTFYCRKWASSPTDILAVYQSEGEGEKKAEVGVNKESYGVGVNKESFGGDDSEERESCSPCEQDCVLSTWSEWSSCRETCAPTIRYRTRRVLASPTPGGIQCEALIETDDCINLPHCTFVAKKTRFTWQAGPWTSCRSVQVRDVMTLQYHV